MSSNIQTIKLWGSDGPNPPKVAIILEELELPHEKIPLDLEGVKKPDYLAINPNGRMPALQDPNTSLTLWESGAIVEYLIERYDTGHRFSFQHGTAEAYHAKQWLFFQTSGQGPYYGQMTWFRKWHPEKLPSAIERYIKEINRVTSVLEGHLSQQNSDGGDGPWLVGNKLSYADLAFLPYQVIMPNFVSKDEYNVDNFPHVKRWLDNMSARTGVQKAMRTIFERLNNGQ